MNRVQSPPMAQQKQERPRRNRFTFYVNADREAIIGNLETTSTALRIGQIIDRYGDLVTAYRDELQKQFTEQELDHIQRSITEEKFPDPSSANRTLVMLVSLDDSKEIKALVRKIKKLDYARTIALLELVSEA